MAQIEFTSYVRMALICPTRQNHIKKTFVKCWCSRYILNKYPYMQFFQRYFGFVGSTRSLRIICLCQYKSAPFPISRNLKPILTMHGWIIWQACKQVSYIQYIPRIPSNVYVLLCTYTVCFFGFPQFCYIPPETTATQSTGHVLISKKTWLL